MFEAMDAALQDLLDRQIIELEIQIEDIITTDETPATTARILRSVTAVARKLVTVVNALCKSRQKWTFQTS